MFSVSISEYCIKKKKKIYIINTTTCEPLLSLDIFSKIKAIPSIITYNAGISTDIFLPISVHSLNEVY